MELHGDKLCDSLCPLCLRGKLQRTVQVLIAVISQNFANKSYLSDAAGIALTSGMQGFLNTPKVRDGMTIKLMAKIW